MQRPSKWRLLTIKTAADSLFNRKRREEVVAVVVVRALLQIRQKCSDHRNSGRQPFKMAADLGRSCGRCTW
eukprot:4973991-Ditylum_brightwellii.AAC.1